MGGVEGGYNLTVIDIIFNLLLQYDILSPASTRRLHAICGVATITAAILSNCVFLVNYQPVLAYLKVIFLKGMFVFFKSANEV